MINKAIVQKNNYILCCKLAQNLYKQTFLIFFSKSCVSPCFYDLKNIFNKLSIIRDHSKGTYSLKRGWGCVFQKRTFKWRNFDYFEQTRERVKRLVKSECTHFFLKKKKHFIEKQLRPAYKQTSSLPCTGLAVPGTGGAGGGGGIG